MKNFFYSVFSLLLLTISSCSKNSGTTGNVNGKTRTELLTQKNWKIVKVELDGVDKTSTVTPCLIDNIITFNVNGTGVVAEGATKCNTTDPDSKSFTWVFTDSETKLSLAGDGMAGTPTILQLDENIMKHQISFGSSIVVNTYAHF